MLKYLLILSVSMFLYSCDKDSALVGSIKLAKVSEDSEFVTSNARKKKRKPKKSKKSKKTKSVPKCSVLCNDSELLKRKRSSDNGYSYLAFPNFGRFGIGRCRGHALLTQKMSLLARFEPGSSCDLNELSCLTEIKTGVRKILNYETHTFRGFHNLWEFSNTPRIKKYLRSVVGGTSHRYKARPGKVLSSRFSTIEANTYTEVEQRLERGHLPYLSIKGLITGTHAVLVYKRSVKDNKPVLCVRDPNFIGSRAENCENYLYRDQEEQVYFQRQNKEADLMLNFKLTADEEGRVLKYKKALQVSCLIEMQKERACK